MGSSSSSQSNPAQQTVTDEGLATIGDLSPINTGSFNINAKGNVEASPIVIKAALDLLEETLGQAVATVGSTAQAQTQTISDLVRGSQDSNDAALGQANALLNEFLVNQSALAQQVQSQGQTETNKTILTAVAIGATVLALLGGLFLWKK